MTGVSAAAIASPFFGELSLGIPHPSITTIGWYQSANCYFSKA